jgi:hypothetical protein
MSSPIGLLWVFIAVREAVAQFNAPKSCVNIGDEFPMLIRQEGHHVEDEPSAIVCVTLIGAAAVLF